MAIIIAKTTFVVFETMNWIVALNTTIKQRGLAFGDTIEDRAVRIGVFVKEFREDVVDEI
jgi:hypothetical protein